MRGVILVDTDQAVLLAMAAVRTAFVTFGFPGTALIAGLERVSDSARSKAEMLPVERGRACAGSWLLHGWSNSPENGRDGQDSGRAQPRMEKVRHWFAVGESGRDQGGTRGGQTVDDDPGGIRSKERRWDSRPSAAPLADLRLVGRRGHPGSWGGVAERSSEAQTEPARRTARWIGDAGRDNGDRREAVPADTPVGGRKKQGRREGNGAWEGEEGLKKGNAGTACRRDP